MCRRRAIALCLLVLAACAQSGLAQNRPGQRQMETLHTTATITHVQPNLLQVKAEDGQQWWVTPPNDIEHIVFRGTAELSFLQPRLAVRFHARFRPTERLRKEYPATEPVTELELITLRPGSEPGLYPESADADGPLLFDAPPPSPPRKPERGEKSPAVDDQSFLVIGTLVEYKHDKIRVSAGPVQVVAELPATAEVTVDVRHFLWARAGDKIELTARYLPGLPGRAEGQEFTITAALPLTGKEKGGKSPRRGGREHK